MSLAKCPTALDCNCSEFPFRNFSSEVPDPATFFSFDFETIYPPLGAPDSWWGTTVGREPCESVVSQQDADDCARRGAETDIWDTWSSGGHPIPLFGNRQTQCSFACPTGFDPFIYTVPAGTVIARSQEDADAIAESLCLFRGPLAKVCIPTKPKFMATPISWWPMEEAVGNRADIITADAAHALVPVGGNDSQVPGKVKKGMMIAPTTYSVQHQSSNSVPDFGFVQTSLTFCGWCNPNTTGLDIGISFNAISAFFNLSFNFTTGTVVGKIQKGGTFATVATVCPVTGTGWFFFLLDYDINTGKVRVQINNGIPAQSAGSAFIPSIASGVMDIYPYTGASIILDELAFFESKLSDSDIAILYNSGNGTTWPIS